MNDEYRLWAYFAAAALGHLRPADNEPGTWHYGDRAAAAGSLADHMMVELRKRYDLRRA